MSHPLGSSVYTNLRYDRNDYYQAEIDDQLVSKRSQIFDHD